MSGGGYIKLYRQLLDWGWYSDTNTFRVFMHLLLTARYDDGEVAGIRTPRGSVACTLSGLSATVNLSVRQVRTAIEHLKSTGEVTVTHFPKFSIIEIKNYDKFQGCDSLSDKGATGQRQSSDRTPTTKQESKKERKKESNNSNTHVRAKTEGGRSAQGLDYELARIQAACGELKLKKGAG